MKRGSFSKKLSPFSGHRATINVLAHSLSALARPVRDRGDLVAARPLLEEALQLAELSGDRQTVARSYHGLGSVLHEQGDFEGATSYFTRSLQLSREIGDDVGMTTELHALAVAMYRQGDVAQCLPYLREVMVLRRALGAHVYSEADITLAAGVAARLQRARAAARLFGAAASVARRIGARRINGGWAEDTFNLVRRDMASTRAQLGPAAFAGAFAAGGSLGVDEAVTEALEVVAALARSLEDAGGTIKLAHE